MKKEHGGFSNILRNYCKFTFSEMSQKEDDKYYVISLICEIYKNQTQKNKLEYWLPRTESSGNREIVDQRVQTCNKKFWSSNAQH